MGVSDKDFDNIIIDGNKGNENNKDDGVIPSEIYGVSHGHVIEMNKQKQKQNNLKDNKSTSTTNTNTKVDPKKQTQTKKSNVSTKVNNTGNKNTKTNYTANKFTKGKTGKK